LNENHFDALNELKTIQNVKGKDEKAHVVSNIVRHRIKCVCMRHGQRTEFATTQLTVWFDASYENSSFKRRDLIYISFSEVHHMKKSKDR
jgi:hypothetical protein